MSLSDPQVPPRGFQLVPSRVDFGSLPDGGSASATVRMKNVGVDSCRYEQQLWAPCGSCPDLRLLASWKVPRQTASSEDRRPRALHPRAGRLPHRRRRQFPGCLSSCVTSLCRCPRGCTWICRSSCWPRLQENPKNRRPASIRTW